MGKRVLFTLALLMSLIGGYSAFAQASRVTGVVVDNYNDPVIGASVLVKGTTVGTITDVNGSFTLNEVPKGKSTLVVSYIGMKTQEVAIKPNLTIRLQEDSQMMEEVVVQVAYGAAKKTSLTGAVSSVDSKTIDKRIATSALNALEGNAAGVQVNNTIGQPGQTATIRIRGIGSYNSSSGPLYVIDGVPMGSESSADINPADIESMTILKDGASAALYGNRAANGVILITTKKGSAGKVNTELRISQGVYQRGTKDYKRLNVKEFMEASWLVQRNMYMQNSGYTAEQAAEYVSSSIIDDVLYTNIFAADKASLFNADGTLRDVKIIDEFAEDLDWYDACLRNGMRSEYTLSSSFGTDKANAFYSFGYLDENGYTKDSRFTRYTGRINTSSKLNKWLKTGLDMNGSYHISDAGAGSDSSTSGSSSNLFYWGRNIAPIYPVYQHYEDGSYILDADGKKQYDMGLREGDDGVIQFTRNWNRELHPLAQQELNLSRTWATTIRATAYAEISFLKDFTFTTKVSGLLKNTEAKSYTNPTVGAGTTLNGILSQTQYRYTNYTAQELLQWKHTFGKHFVDVMAGHENYYYRYDYNNTYVTDQILETGIYISNFSTDAPLVYGYGNGYVTEGYLARVRYNYNEKYNVEASFRRDGSSRVSPSQRWGNFFSLGANWIISEENFMKDIKWVDMLKVRASFGQVGIDATSSYFSYMSLATVTSMDSDPVYYVGSRGNEALTWETAETYDFALEARLFDRWNIQVEYFEKYNKDLLFSVSQPLSQGSLGVYSSSPWAVTTTQNIGTMKNWGWEFSTDVDIYRNRNWRVNVGANASFLRNKFVKLPDQMMTSGGTTSGNYLITEGKSRYTWYLYSWAGVDQMTGRSLYKADFGADGSYYCVLDDGTAVGNTAGSKVAMYDDDGTQNVVYINGDYYVYNTTYARKEMHGQALPKVYGGVNTNISYKDISFSALFTYRFGGKVYDGLYDGLMSSSSTTQMHHDVLKSWREAPEGMTETSADRIDPNAIPMLTGYSDWNSYNNATSSRFLTSGRYLVIKNVNVAYSLPKRWLQPLGIRSATVTGAVENLATFTARRGLNPQISLSGEVSSNYLTIPRTFVFGLNIKL